MFACCFIVILACGAAPSVNLLSNGGFELGEGGLPADWSLFAMPHTQMKASQPEGRLDETGAFEGKRSVMLRNPESYKQEPYNNWSQQAQGVLPGKKLRLKAQVKTENATGASVWLQCWRKSPLSVLYLAETRSLTNTQDWTPVETSFTVPADTDFAIVRCVLMGTGAAWFDNVAVIDETPPEENPKDVVAEEMVKASERMAETVKALRQSNESLLKSLGQLQEEVRSLREQLQTNKESSSAARSPEKETESAQDGRRANIPVLVPHEPEPKEAE